MTIITESARAIEIDIVDEATIALEPKKSILQ